MSKIILSALGGLVVGVVATSLVGVQFNQDERNVNVPPSQTTAHTAVLGQSCDQNKVSNSADAPKGLQCYFYGQVGPNGESRHGIWIKPDIDAEVRVPSSDFLRNISWKIYTNAKLGLAFEYPSTYKVQAGGFDSPNTVKVTNSFGDQVFTFTTSANVSVSDLEAQNNYIEKQNSIASKEGFQNQQGLEGTVHKFKPWTNLEPAWVLYDLQYSNDKLVSVQFNKGLGTDIDYINDAMLQSLRAIK